MPQADPDIPAFHYGSHYSAAGVVLFYLLRLEPFTGLARTLQARTLLLQKGKNYVDAMRSPEQSCPAFPNEVLTAI
jgi:hypothetical protein